MENFIASYEVLDFVQKQNIRSQNTLKSIDPTVAYVFGTLIGVISILFFYFFKKMKNKKDFLIFIYGADLVNVDVSKKLNDPKKFSGIYDEKWLSINRINWWHRQGYLVFLYAGIFFVLFSITLFMGKPLGII